MNSRNQQSLWDRSPEEIERDPKLDIAERIRLLEEIRHDAVELQTATAENMTGPADTAGEATEQIRRVDAALGRIRDVQSGSD